jgi:signal transduction histidine kinase
MASPQIADDVLAVVREALTNVARHSGATRAGVDVEVTGCLVCVQVTDDGSGLGDQVRRSGLANLRTRAERHGGTLTVADHEGAVLTWTVPAG